jgi:hypothetical protein
MAASTIEFALSLVWALASNACSAESHRVKAPDTSIVAELRRVSRTVIKTKEQEAETWRVIHQTLESGVLVGMRKPEVVEALGPGYRCEYVVGAGDGAERDCYAVGRLRELAQGGTPLLALDFDEDGVCINAIAVHTQ